MLQILLPALLLNPLPLAQDEAVAEKAPAVTLVSKVTAGQVIESTYSVTSELELTESLSSQNGEEMEGGMEKSSSNQLTLEVTDTVESDEDGEATKWGRTFDSIKGSFTFDLSMEGEMGMEPISEEGELSSPLDGESVVFEREEGDVTVRPGDESDLDEEAVSGLNGDMTLAFLLPDDTVEQGATWSVGPESIDTLLGLGGDVGGESGDMGMMMGGGEDAEDPEYSGKIEMTYSGMREVDGRSLVVIAIKVETEMTQVSIPDVEIGVEGDAPEGAIVPDDLEFETTDAYEGKGELLWDAEAGMLVECTLSLEQTKTTLQSMSFDIPGMGAMEIENTEVEEGETEVSLTRSLKS